MTKKHFAKRAGFIFCFVFLTQNFLFCSPFSDGQNVQENPLNFSTNKSPQISSSHSQNLHFRVASYNIAHARGNEEKDSAAKPKNLKGIVNLLKSEQIDIAGITEISSRDLRARFFNQPQFIARALGFHWVYGENVRKGLFGILRTQGNSVISRYPIISWKDHKLYQSNKKNEQRSCLEALLDIGNGKKLRFFVCHLSLLAEEHPRQVIEVWNLIKSHPEPSLLVGDFNARPSKKPIAWLSTKMKDTTNEINSTFLEKPNVKIDYHFVRGRIQAGKAWKRGFKEGYSDHSCVLNDYWLNDGQ